VIDVDYLSLQIERVLKKSERFESPCGGGSLIIRRWSGPEQASDSIVLVHGGSGSWTHWYNNIEYLASRFHVYAIDLPGLGDSEALAPGYSAMDAVEAVSAGIQALPELGPFHLVAFSWGCAVSSQIVKLHQDQLLSLLLVGPASIGDIPRRGLMEPLIKRHSGMSQEQVFSANKENLARLMIHQRLRIDDMAVYIQTENTNRARFNSPQFVRSTLVLDGVRGMKAPLKVIYGQNDAPGLPDIESKEALFRAVKPDVHFEIVPDAGHWLQYERSEIFNSMCEQWLNNNKG
jgi:2-hydroxy-6-oxonona-2,4-dienedioate hydrolase